MTKEELINKITKEINPTWNKDQIIRYAYLEIGKKIKKDVKFFYTLNNKGEQKDRYNYYELKERYDNCISLNMICKSAAYFIKEVLDKFNIESEVIKTTSSIYYKDALTGNELEVKHFFLKVKGHEDKEYFLTIIPDLANIQLGMSTEHFGNGIKYLSNDKPIYEGEEVNCYIFSSDEIKNLDLSINKIGNKIKIGKTERYMYFDEIIDYFQTKYINNEYISVLSTETEIYKQAMTFYLPSGEKVSFNDYEDCRCVTFADLDEEAWDCWLNNLKRVINKELFEYHAKWDDEIINTFKALTKIIESIDLDKVSSLTPHDKKVYFLRKRRAISKLIEKISLKFVEDSLKYDWDKDNKAKEEYIVSKFEKMFPLVMGVGTQALTTKVTGFAEQLTVIDFVLEKLFKELKHSALDDNIDGDLNKKPIHRIIQHHTIQMNDDKSYAIIFNIKKSNKYYFFHPSKGIFIKIDNLLDFLTNTICISNSLKNKNQSTEATIEDIENELISNEEVISKK